MPKVGTYVALMRGINVGGKNKLPMRELATIFTETGCKDVRTYIQSGNVMFGASDSVAKRVPAAVTKRISEEYGYRVPVVMRTANELRKVATANPFLKSGIDTKTLHVAFLADRPDRRKVSQLDPDRSPGDSFQVKGSEIYIHLPNGAARSKLTNDYFDSRLDTISTVRNWRTVLKLIEMTAETRNL